MKRLLFILLLIPWTAQGAVVDHNFDDLTWGGLSHGSFWTIQSSGGVSDSPAARLEYSVCGTSGKNLSAYLPSGTDEGWIEFDVKVEGTINGGMKFVKWFGVYDQGETWENWNNTTFGINYNTNQFFDIGYYGDSLRTIRYNGTYVGGSPTIVTYTNTWTFTPGNWYHYKAYLKRATVGTATGEIQAWVDGVTKIHATGLENNPTGTKTSAELSHVELGGYNDCGENSFENGVSPTWYLWVDNLVVDTVEPSTVPTNGECNTDVTSQSYIDVCPSVNLCSAGTPSNVTQDADSCDWTCVGYDGGTTATCTAAWSEEIIPTVFTTGYFGTEGMYMGTSTGYLAFEIEQ